MFTGIVQALGELKQHHVNDQGCGLVIDLSALSIATMKIGDSVAVNGACLTVVEEKDGLGRFDVSLESLAKTDISQWQVGQYLNLELALNLSTLLGGHLVTGHVDGLGQLDKIIDQGDATEMYFRVPVSLARLVANKGSICINGVSLTSNHIVDLARHSIISVTLVPHTLQVTSLGQLQPDDNVHLEIDLIARYLDRMRSYETSNPTSSPG